VVAGALFLIARPGLSGKTIALGTNAAASKPLTFLSTPADFVTPLGQGYLFFNRATRGVSYGSAAGTTNVSGSYSLTTDPNPSKILGGDSVADTVVNIEPVTGGGAVVTTTKGAFLVSAANAVTKLPDFTDRLLDFTSSAYDAGTNSLFALSAYSKTVYRYDLSRPAAPTEVYTAPREINHIAAAGSKFVVFFDDVPNAEPGVLAAYAKTRQLDPLVVDATTFKLVRTLSGLQPVTNISVSGSGKYLAIKRKYEPTVTLHSLSGGQNYRLPGYDTGGAGWQADTYFLAREKAVWSFDPNAKAGVLTKVAEVAEPVTHLRLTATDTILTVNTGQTMILGQLTQTKAPLVVAPQSGGTGPFTYLAPPAEKE
jgi:hypothetical protein